MTRMNHEKRNRAGKAGPSFSYDGFEEHLRYLASEIDELKAKIREGVLNSGECRRKYDENEGLIVKLAYELSVECIHGFIVLWCSSCKNTDFQGIPEFKSLIENRARLDREISLAEAKVNELVGEIQKLRR